MVAHVEGDERETTLVCNSMVLSVGAGLLSRIRVCFSMLAKFDTGLVKGLVNERFEGDGMA